MVAKNVTDPEGLNRECKVTLYQGMWEIILKSIMTGQVWISPRFWSYEAGNLGFVLIFPILVIGSLLRTACKVYFFQRGSRNEENDGEQKSCLCETWSKMMSYYKDPLPCLYNRSIKQIIQALFAFYDVYTDFEYLLTVPIFSGWIIGFMIASLMAPFFISLYMAYD